MGPDHRLDVLPAVSRHALERYRIHFPDAEPDDVAVACVVAVWMPSDLAHALVGRRGAWVADEQHRLHVEGTGLFVVVPGTEGAPCVATYLRLVSEEQRRLARRWFLDPMVALRAAFELGFEAARSGDASAVAASRRQEAALARLAPTLGGHAPVTPAPPPAPSPPAAPAAGIGPPGFAVTADAATQLAWFHGAHVGFEPDVAQWGWLSPAGFGDALAPAHVGAPGAANAARIEPQGFAVVFVQLVDGAPPRLLRLVNVARPDRGRLLAQVVGEVPIAVSPRVERPAGRAREVHLVSPAALRTTAWTGRALRLARELDVEPIAAPWLHLLPAVPTVELAELVAGEPLGDGDYAAYRQADVLYLLHRPPGAADAVVRSVARLRPAARDPGR